MLFTCNKFLEEGKTLSDLSAHLDSNLSYATTQVTNMEWPLYRGGHITETYQNIDVQSRQKPVFCHGDVIGGPDAFDILRP